MLLLVNKARGICGACQSFHFIRYQWELTDFCSNKPRNLSLLVFFAFFTLDSFGMLLQIWLCALLSLRTFGWGGTRQGNNAKPNAVKQMHKHKLDWNLSVHFLFQSGSVDGQPLKFLWTQVDTSIHPKSVLPLEISLNKRRAKSIQPEQMKYERLQLSYPQA